MAEVTDIFSFQFFLYGCQQLLVVVCLPLNNVDLISLFKQSGLEIFILHQQHHTDCGYPALFIHSPHSHWLIA